MSDMSKHYDPSAIEGTLFQGWYDAGYFHRGSEQPETGKDPYTIVIPPPNVTGVLHMGHALNDTIQDAVIRRARMQGHPARWILGTDHAAIATQNKVEQLLAKQGKSRHQLGREAFLKECWKWRDEYGGAIVEQIKGMGCSCDYDDERFTMDPSYNISIRRAFCDWYHDDLIYRGNRIINWCPRCNTALADDEVEHEEENGHLWHLRYPLKEPVGGRDYIVVATTRPETMLGDTGVAVNPKDERYKDLVGAMVVLPIVGREIPIFADRYVDASFGTGCVKVTPAHDPNDYEMGIRHDLEQINILDGDAVLNENAGEFAGMDRYEAREAIVERFEELGLLDHIDDHVHTVGHCYRCDTTVEPWLSEQWFVRMKPLAEPAMQAVRDGRVVFHPARWEHVYFQWMENVRDWCISRQLWWGHRIPVFHCDECGWEDALMEDTDTCPRCGAPAHQDEDVLDTWFSSQLWPFATMGWPDASTELETCYPTQMLSTARDIMGLWVARMVMSSLYFMEEIPFQHVVIHPTVLDSKGRRMSKSLGNGVDPLKLIEDYGADGMRFGLLMQVTGAQDMKFDEKKLESSRNFATKIWNAARFVLMNLDGYEPGEPIVETDEDAWILSRLGTLAADVDTAFEDFNFGAATRELYNFFWNAYCDWYIEFSKVRLNAGGADRLAAQRNLVFVLDQALRLLHPMMPFVTEEIWQRLPHGDSTASLMVAAWPDAAALAGFADARAEQAVTLATSVITSIRATRARYGISPHRELAVCLRLKAQGTDEQVSYLERESDLIRGLARLESLTILDAAAEKPSESSVDLVGDIEVYTNLSGLVDFAAEKERLIKEKAKAEKELAKLDKKLENENFVAKAAPEAIEKARSQHADLTSSISLIEAQLGDM